MTGREDKGSGMDDTRPLAHATDDSPASDLISPDHLLSFLDDAETEDSPGEDGAVPRITRMPEGIEVEERHVGRAVAQWILNVRCECGRRWFEIEEIDTATCPRCGMLVYVDMDAQSQRK